jgi:uncharacterized membrane protein YbhN (UPF0104 family)
MKQALRKSLKYVVTIVIFVAFLRWIDFVQHVDKLTDIDGLDVSVACVLMLLGISVRGLRFYYIAARVGKPISLSRSIAACYVANLLALVTPGRVGELGKVSYFENKKTLGLLAIFEKLLDTALLALGAYTGLYLLDSFVNAYLIFVVGLIAAVVGLLFIDRIINLVLRKKHLESGYTLSLSKEIGWPGWAGVLSLSVLLWMIGIFVQYFLLKSLGLDFDILFLVQVSSLSVLAGVLSDLPTGLGVSQASFTALSLIQYPAAKVEVGLFNILLLLCVYTIGILAGIISSLYLKRSTTKSSKIVVSV